MPRQDGITNAIPVTWLAKTSTLSVDPFILKMAARPYSVSDGAAHDRKTKDLVGLVSAADVSRCDCCIHSSAISGVRLWLIADAYIGPSPVPKFTGTGHVWPSVQHKRRVWKEGVAGVPATLLPPVGLSLAARCAICDA